MDKNKFQTSEIQVSGPEEEESIPVLLSPACPTGSFPKPRHDKVHAKEKHQLIPDEIRAEEEFAAAR